MRDPFDYLHLPQLDAVDTNESTSRTLQNPAAEQIGTMLTNIGSKIDNFAPDEGDGILLHIFDMGARAVDYAWEAVYPKLAKGAHRTVFDPVDEYTTLAVSDPTCDYMGELRHFKKITPFSTANGSKGISHQAAAAMLSIRNPSQRGASHIRIVLPFDKASWFVESDILPGKHPMPYVDSPFRYSKSVSKHLTKAAAMLVEVIEKIKSSS